MRRSTICVALFLLPAGPAAAERPTVEWSTWIRAAYGLVDHGDPDAQALGVVMPSGEPERGWEAAGGVEASLPIAKGGDLRLGAWAEARTSSYPVGGAELVIGASPAELDMFFYKGEGVWIVRGGGNDEVVTGAVAYGYRCPWDLYGPQDGTSRYMIGVRFVASATRSIADPDDWTVSLGLETEPVGALRYLLGIRAWY